MSIIGLGLHTEAGFLERKDKEDSWVLLMFFSCGSSQANVKAEAITKQRVVHRLHNAIALSFSLKFL